MNVGTLRLVGLAVLAIGVGIWIPARQYSSSRPSTGSIVGYPRIIDGDTLDLAGRRIRLDGIDAPEASQTCVLNTAVYGCGAQATMALTELVRGQSVRCFPVDVDRYQRTLARCRTEGDNADINSWLVRQGFAVAYVQYSYRYLPEELLARIARRGLWAGDFQMPWDYRSENRHARGRTWW